MYQCKYCGKVCKTKSSLSQHEKYHCEKNPDRQTFKKGNTYKVHKQAICSKCGKSFDVANIKKHEAACGTKKPAYVQHEGLNCIYCGKLCKHKNSLAQHELRCSQNPERRCFDSLAEYMLNNPVKGQTKETHDRVAKSAATIKARHDAGELLPPTAGKPGTFTGKKHSAESKEKTRLSTLKYLKDTVGEVKPRYNKNACRYIDFLNSKNNWNLQHAENGGEFSIRGYFVDGYDKALNIVFEYDEPRHYSDVKANKLCERDIIRMKEIVESLHCKFYRYNEKLDLFYEVDTSLL